MNSMYEMEQMVKARHQELQHEAEQWRDKHPQTPPSDRFYAPMMARMGVMLTDVGTQLQTRYSDVQQTVEEATRATQTNGQLVPDPCADVPC